MIEEQLRAEVDALKRHLAYSESRRCKHDERTELQALKAQVSGLLSQVADLDAERKSERAKNDPNGKWRKAERVANMEEAARAILPPINDQSTSEEVAIALSLLPIADKIRALAPLPQSCVVVEKEELRAMQQCLTNWDEDNSGKHLRKLSGLLEALVNR